MNNGQKKKGRWIMNNHIWIIPLPLPILHFVQVPWKSNSNLYLVVVAILRLAQLICHVTGWTSAGRPAKRPIWAIYDSCIPLYAYGNGMQQKWTVESRELWHLKYIITLGFGRCEHVTWPLCRFYFVLKCSLCFCTWYVSCGREMSRAQQSISLNSPELT